MIVSYTRVSTEDQANDHATSLAEQERKNRAVAQLRGVDLRTAFVNYVDAGVSGSIPLRDRPAGKDMLESLNPGDCVVATKLDRLFRSAADALTTADEFKRQGIDLVLIDFGVDPINQEGVAKMFFGMLALVAEFERHLIAERMASGRRASRARGGHSHGKTPYGFRVEGKGRASRLRPCDAELTIVRLAQQLRAGGAGLKKIATELDLQGKLSRTGKKFLPEQIRRMLATDTKFPMEVICP